MILGIDGHEKNAGHEEEVSCKSRILIRAIDGPSPQT
jgi:hypothetical protein